MKYIRSIKNIQQHSTTATRTMFILWTKKFHDYNNKCVLFCKNTLEELKETFAEFCEKKDLGNTTLKEKELDTFSAYDNDNDDELFYYSKVKRVNADKPIYILKFGEDGGGGSWHREYYFEISNSKTKILKTATDYFIQNSEDNDEKDIAEMIRGLKSRVAQYIIPNSSSSYSCSLDLIVFKAFKF